MPTSQSPGSRERVHFAEIPDDGKSLRVKVPRRMTEVYANVQRLREISQFVQEPSRGWRTWRPELNINPLRSLQRQPGRGSFRQA